jgi:putative ABC transport system permease protein
MVLVVSAGLLIASFARLSGTDPGFRTSSIMRMKVTLAGTAYAAAPARRQFFSGLQEGVKSLPGVSAAGVVTRFPLHDSNVTTSVLVEGGVSQPAEKLPDADLRQAGGDYFGAMGIPVLHGRGFGWQERTDSGAVPIAVINHAAAVKLFGTDSPVGRRMQLGGHARAPFVEVVGVVGNVHDASLREAPRPQVYLSAQQGAPRSVSLVVRSEAAHGAVLAGVRNVVRSLDPSLPVYDVQSVEDVISAASLGDRFTTLLLAAFSSLALLLAALGTYGVIALGVNERTREIGVRMALGAPRARVRAMVLREGALLLAVALPIGALGAWGAMRLLRGLLFGVTPLDPAPTALSALVLVGAALAACYIPARRASNVDPIVAMRSAD